MSLIDDIKTDLIANKKFSNANKVLIFISNRGFHAVLFYRLSNLFFKCNIPLIPMVLTRIIQVFYSIDIDYKASIMGGLVIVHGVGLVIGYDTTIKENVILFHGVTLGRRGIGAVISETDGFPVLHENCIICAGAKIIGKINIGANSIIGANCVITKSVSENQVVKINELSMVINPRKIIS